MILKRKIKSVDHIVEILKDGEPHQFVILLKPGLVSRKELTQIRNSKDINILNIVDGSEQRMTPKMISEFSNIGTAIKNGIYYLIED